MQILIKPESVFAEMIELACLKMAEIMRIHPQAIRVRVHARGVPEFSVDADAAKGLSREEISQVISAVWGQFIKPELHMRLAYVGSRRRGSQKEKETTAPQESRPIHGPEKRPKGYPKEKATWWKRVKRWWRKTWRH